MTPGILVYRCRACGKLDNSAHAPNLTRGIESVMSGDAGTMVDRWSIHSCDDGMLGVTDLVGGWPDHLGKRPVAPSPEKITAIHGGGDWADASAEYLILPKGVDIEKEQEAWRQWYSDAYCPALRRGGRPEFFTLFQWCLKRGATEPSKDQLEVYES